MIYFGDFNAAVGGDPHWSNVVYLGGYDRSPSSSSNYTEESANARTMISTGSGASTTDVDSKFGVGSARGALSAGNRVQDYWYVANNADFQFGSGAFTLDAWVRFDKAPSSSFHHLLGLYDTGANQRSWALTVEAGVLELLLSTAGTSGTAYATSAFSPTLGVWYHIGADFDGTAYRTYLDGAMVGKSTAAITLHNSTARLSITAATNSNACNTAFGGMMDEVRITKGVARYASDSGFTVPTAAYPRS